MIRLTLHNAATREDGSPWPPRWRREREMICKTRKQAISEAETRVNAGEAQRISYKWEGVIYTYVRGRGWISRKDPYTNLEYTNRPEK